MKRITLVEDDRFIQDFVSQKLIEAGYQMSVCGDGEVAFDVITANNPDLLLLDLDLPNRNGFDILKELRADEKYAKTPVIIFSNNDDPTIKQQVLKAGAQDFYMKATTDTEELIEKIKALL